MADVELERRGLNSERWAELLAFTTSFRRDLGITSDVPVEIKLDVPREINGWVYMPAVYFPA